MRKINNFFKKLFRGLTMSEEGAEFYKFLKKSESVKMTTDGIFEMNINKLSLEEKQTIKNQCEKIINNAIEVDNNEC